MGTGTVPGWNNVPSIQYGNIFTALHGMQRGLTMRFLSVCRSVCLTVCPSVKHVHCDKTEERYV